MCVCVRACVLLITYTCKPIIYTFKNIIIYTSIHIIIRTCILNLLTNLAGFIINILNHILILGWGTLSTKSHIKKCSTVSR